MIPLILKLRIRQKNRKVFGIWIPIFILWLIVLPLLALPAPAVLLVAMILWKEGKGRLILFSYLAMFSIIGNLSGLKFDIQSKDNTVIYMNLR